MSETLFQRFCAQAASWPTAYVEGVDPETSRCCALHQVVEVHDKVGCGDWPHGTHVSIRALYDTGTHMCHAEVGQKVIDRELFRGVVEMPEGFAKAGLFRTRRFARRYMMGFPVAVSVYGRGYCYLGAMEDTARSRVARCLGPLAWVADVLRMYMFVGLADVSHLRVVEVGPAMYHFEENGKREGSRHQFVWELMRILAEHPYASVGMDVGREAGEVEPNVVVMAPGVASEGMLSPYPLVDVMGSGPWVQVLQARLGVVLAWAAERELKTSPEFLGRVALATTAPNVLDEPLCDVKDVLRSWALLGDAVVRLFVAARCVSDGVSPAEFDGDMRMATNKEMTRLFHESGLRAIANVGDLSFTSKGNADMFEAVVGVVALFHDTLVVARFLQGLGVLRPLCGASHLREVS